MVTKLVFARSTWALCLAAAIVSVVGIGFTVGGGLIGLMHEADVSQSAGPFCNKRNAAHPVNDDESPSPSLSPRQRVAEVASAILHGELDVIEGSRLLCDLRSQVSSLDYDPDFIPFVGIDSETDHLPVSDVRKHWARDALASKDQEIRAAEAFFRDRAVAGCERLLVRFGSSPEDSNRERLP